tara:strand:+ start:14132 stop:14581 length:450 start_codon:yes stop_codon:yes gene_type:complete
MIKLLKIIPIVLILPFTVIAQDQEEEILESMLHEFLQGASENDVNAHIRFWSDDLIYTSATAERFGKEDILSSYEDAVEQPDSLLPDYYGDEIEIQIYGDTAIVAFRLNADIPLESGGSEHYKYYNTGTFIKEMNEWKVVAWHVTMIPD